MNISYTVKQQLKKILQVAVLPLIYKAASRSKIQKGKIIFVDGHSEKINANMRDLYDRIKSMGYTPMDLCANYNELGTVATTRHLIKFMKEYATAEYVFISDYYLPIASCKKRHQTKVIQLWHAGGMLKKMGYDASDDLKNEKRISPTRNFDLVTTSASACEAVWAQAWHIPVSKVKALGIARTDKYYNGQWNKVNVQTFYRKCPDAYGKKICIYAPSFEGRASSPHDTGLESGIFDVFNRLSDEWFVVVKLHPHMQHIYPQYNFELSSEELFAVSDMLITDYSSIIFDYLIYKKPFVLYAPDLEQYMKNRGFYLDYMSLPAPIIRDKEALYRCMKGDEWKSKSQELDECFDTYMGACDGHAIDRILYECGLLKEEKNDN